MNGSDRKDEDPASASDLFSSSELPSSMHDEPTRQQPSAMMDDDPTQVMGAAGFDADATTVGGSPQFEAPGAPAPMDNETTGELPAHLQLPSIDFSLPSSVGSGSGTSGVAAAAPADLPAHLQLPSFPQFDLPPIPGDGRRNTGEVDIQGNLGGSFGAMNEPSQPQGQPAPAGAQEGWEVAATRGAVAPPPPPRPPARKKREVTPEPAPAPTAAAATGFLGLPELPQVGLPAVKQGMKREPTLIQADVAAQLAAVKKKSFAGPLIFGLLIAGGLGAGAFLFKDQIIEQVAGPTKVEVVETPADKARRIVAEGKKAYEGGKLDEAVVTFQEAISIDPSYGNAHRALAIAFAKMNKAEKAVEHYRVYLALTPKAEDAAEVQKIIADYEKKKTPEPAPAQEEPKKKKGRR